MISYLLDTNHASAILNEDVALLEQYRDAKDAEFSLSMPGIAELWFMVFNSSKVQKNSEKLERFLADMVKWEFDEEAAKEFGRIKAELRRVGRPIPDPDAQIAAIARLNGLIVLTADAHFGYISGLRTENWTQ